MTENKKKHNKIVSVEGIKLNSKINIISKVLNDNGISREVKEREKERRKMRKETSLN